MPLNGFTEITPGRLTVPMIVSPDGKTYFDVAKGKIGGNIVFQSTSGKEKTVTELEADAAKDATAKANSALTSALKANAILEETIIDGGYIRTELIDTNALKVGNKTLITNGKLTTDLIDANTITARKLDTTSGGVGGIVITRGVTHALDVYNDLGDLRMYIDREANSWGLQTTWQTDFTSLSNIYGLQFFDRDCHILYPNGAILQARFNRDGIKLPPTATVDMPGVLCAGSVSKGGKITNQWGCVTCSATSYYENGIRKMGYFRIIHSLNHTNYFLQITGAELWNGVEPIIIGTVISKGRNEAIVAISGSNSKTFVDAAFEFCLIGQGKQ